MDATPFYQGHAAPTQAFGLPQCLSPFPAKETDKEERMHRQWPALHQAAEAVAAMAGISATPMTARQRNFPEAACAAGGWRLELAQQGVDDIAAIMEPGLAALFAAHARGANAPAAAFALWEEFCNARDALMALLPTGTAPAQ